MACSYCEREDAEVGVLCLRGFELGFSLRDGFVGIDAGLIENFGKVQRFLVGDHGGIQQLFQIVLAAKRVIIHGNFGLSGQARIFEIRGASLRGRSVGAHLIAHAAPEIGNPGGVERQL